MLQSEVLPALKTCARRMNAAIYRYHRRERWFKQAAYALLSLDLLICSAILIAHYFDGLALLDLVLIKSIGSNFSNAVPAIFLGLIATLAPIMLLYAIGASAYYRRDSLESDLRYLLAVAPEANPV